MTDAFEEVLVTLEVSLTLVYHFQPRAEIPRASPSPQLPGVPPVTPPKLPFDLPATPPSLPPASPPLPSVSPPTSPSLVALSPRIPRSPQATPGFGEQGEGRGDLQTGRDGPAIAIAVLFAITVGLGALCCCRFGRRSQRALKQALQPKQLIEPVVELPQMAVGPSLSNHSTSGPRVTQ